MGENHIAERKMHMVMEVRSGVVACPAVELGPQVHLGPERPCRRLFEPIMMDEVADYRRKPQDGGFWTSSLQFGMSQWIDWCRANQYGMPEREPWWLLIPQHQGEVIVIQDRQTFDQVHAAYKKPIGFGSINHPGTEYGFDFPKMIRDGFVGLHVTRDAAARLAWPEITVGPDGITTTQNRLLSSWSVESTVWFAWDFAEPTTLDYVPEE